MAGDLWARVRRVSDALRAQERERTRRQVEAVPGWYLERTGPDGTWAARFQADGRSGRVEAHCAAELVRRVRAMGAGSTAPAESTTHLAPAVRAECA